MGGCASALAGAPNAEALSADRNRQMRAAFRAVDTNKDGVLSFEEVKAAFEKVGEIVSDERLQDIFGAIDRNCDSKIDCAEFCRMENLRVCASSFLHPSVVSEIDRASPIPHPATDSARCHGSGKQGQDMTPA